MNRGTKRIPQRSARRIAEQPDRDAYRDVVPEISCGWLPGRRELEVDELVGGASRSIEYTDPERCRAVCPVHHDYKTDHKVDVLRRIGER